MPKLIIVFTAILILVRHKWNIGYVLMVASAILADVSLGYDFDNSRQSNG
ncbi:MAG: hypothetical protein ACLPX5_13775 [Dissulfurispiraceae bacterium]